MTPSARDRMLDAAEHLFAERGLEGVSLREIGAAAGQRNHSAVQYHFGTRGALILALYERRMPNIDRHRSLLLDELEASGRHHDVVALARVLVEPFAELLRSPELYAFAQFAAHVDITGTLGDLHDLTLDMTSAAHRTLELARPLLGHLDDEQLHRRTRIGTSLVVQEVARRARRLRAGHATAMAHDDFVAELSMLVAANVMAPLPAQAWSR